MAANPSLIFTQPIVSGSGAKNNRNCSVELLGLAIYGNYNHGYSLPCIDEGAQRLVVTVQDRLPESDRNSRRWRLLIARLGTCHRTGNDRVSRRMALWSARRVEHLSTDPRVKACNDVLERWLNDEATDGELKDAAASASAAASYAAASYYASASAAAAADAAAASYYASVSAAAYASAAASYASAAAYESLIEFVDDYLTAWLKVAADEGCLIPDEADAEYAAFLAALDFMEQGQVEGG